MIAKVVSIESGTQYTDGRRRITLKFDAADHPFGTVRFSERALGIIGLRLDDAIEIAFGCDAVKIREERRARREPGAEAAR